MAMKPDHKKTLEFLAQKMVTNSTEHTALITEYFAVIITAVTNEFPEDSKDELTDYLQHCFDTALTNRGL